MSHVIKGDFEIFTATAFTTSKRQPLGQHGPGIHDRLDVIAHGKEDGNKIIGSNRRHEPPKSTPVVRRQRLHFHRRGTRRHSPQ